MNAFIIIAVLIVIVTVSAFVLFYKFNRGPFMAFSKPSGYDKWGVIIQTLQTAKDSIATKDDLRKLEASFEGEYKKHQHDELFVKAYNDVIGQIKRKLGKH